MIYTATDHKKMNKLKKIMICKSIFFFSLFVVVQTCIVRGGGALLESIVFKSLTEKLHFLAITVHKCPENIKIMDFDFYIQKNIN
jgi:hypothetical protein